MKEYIIEYRDGYYYFDETSELIGPFTTEEQADIALSATLRWLDKDHKPNLRKMKDDPG